MGSHLSAVWRALNAPVAWQEGEAGSTGWVFSRCVCVPRARNQGPAGMALQPSPALPTRVLFLGCLEVSRRREAAHWSALRPPSAAMGHVLSGLLFLLRNGDADAHGSGLLGNERNGRVRGSQETEPQGVCGVIESPDAPGGTEDTCASLAGSQGQ